MSQYIADKQHLSPFHITQEGRFLIEIASERGWTPFWRVDNEGVDLPTRFNDFIDVINCIVENIISIKLEITEGTKDFKDFPQADQYRIIDTKKSGIYRLSQNSESILIRYPGGAKWESIPVHGGQTLH